MLEINAADVAARAVNSLLTLYMMVILLRWLAGYIQIDLYNRRLRWIRQITDPLINQIRRFLPAMGPFDFAPIIALFLVWLLRNVLVMMVSGAAGRPTV